MSKKYTLQIILLCDHAFEFDIPSEFAATLNLGSKLTLENIRDIALFEDSANEMLNMIREKSKVNYFIVDDINNLVELNWVQFILVEDLIRNEE